MCEACEQGRHTQCGMQTWCECDCDGSPEAMADPYPDMDNEYDDDPEDDDFDCALMPDGQCLKAGSEECDWSCPNSHGEDYAGSEAYFKKHGK